jgi:hypothetical protein
LWLKALPQSI